MTDENKLKLKRFVGFSLCNAPGTLIELLVLWLLSDILFHSHGARFVLAPVIAFECSMLVDFVLFSSFVWRENVGQAGSRSFFKRLAMFNVSTVGVYLLRLGLIQVLNLLFGIGAVMCDLVAMFFSGLLNFGINDRLIFAKSDGHSTWVRLLMGLARPFVTLKVQGTDNLPPETNGPVVYVCNHGFLFGPVAAVFNLPSSFRPWIDNRALNVTECAKDVGRLFGRRLRLLGHRARRKVVDRVSRWVVALLRDFNPIPVFKNGSRNVIDTIEQSVDALMSGDNLLIFPERPRKDYKDVDTERKQASRLRSFYMGFAKIGQDYYQRTGQQLRFVPVYINRKHRTMQIAPSIAYQCTADSHADRERLSMDLYTSLAQLSGQAV